MPTEIYDELVQEFYGLDPQTRLVDCVSITKSGQIHRWTAKSGYLVKQMSGESMQAEVTRLYGLTHLIAVEPDASLELRKQVMAGLQATALLSKN